MIRGFFGYIKWMYTKPIISFLRQSSRPLTNVQPFTFRLFLLTRSLIVVALYKKCLCLLELNDLNIIYFIRLVASPKPGVYYDIVTV